MMSEKHRKRLIADIAPDHPTPMVVVDEIDRMTSPTTDEFIVLDDWSTETQKRFWRPG